MKYLKTTIALACFALGFAATAAFAQSQGTFGTYSLRSNRPAVQTLAAVAAATYVSADQVGYGSALVCVYTQSAHTGSPTATFSLEGKFGTGTYVSLLSAAAIVATDGSTPLYIGAGVPNATNVSLGIPLPAVWRTKVVISGGSTTTTAHVDCSTAG